MLIDPPIPDVLSKEVEFQLREVWGFVQGSIKLSSRAKWYHLQGLQKGSNTIAMTVEDPTSHLGGEQNSKAIEICRGDVDPERCLKNFKQILQSCIIPLLSFDAKNFL